MPDEVLVAPKLVVTPLNKVDRGSIERPVTPVVVAVGLHVSALVVPVLLCAVEMEAAVTTLSTAVIRYFLS